MPRNNSSHMLSLPSAIFKSKSALNLRPSEQNSAALYTATASAATETALPHIREDTSASLFDRPDNTITALPPAAPTEPKRKKSFWHRPPTPVAASPIQDQSVQQAREAPKSTWRRVTSKLKASFRGFKFGRKTKGSDSPPQIRIGSPKQFQHLGSLGGRGLRNSQGHFTVTAGGQEDEAVVEKEDGPEDEWEDVEE